MKRYSCPPVTTGELLLLWGIGLVVLAIVGVTWAVILSYLPDRGFLLP